MESLGDLLAPKGIQPHPLSIREDHQIGLTYVEGLSKHRVRSATEVKSLLHEGYLRRISDSTNLNEVSSRSHMVFITTVERKPRLDGRELGGRGFTGRLYCVDLAGSERIKKSGSTGTRLEEAKAINLSLLQLGNVISSIANGRHHIGFRDSKLTRLLEESLSGNCKTTLIVNAPPSNEHYMETCSSMQFAERAMKIATTAYVNAESVDYKSLWLELSLRMESMEASVELAPGDRALMERLDLLEEEIQAKSEQLELLEAERCPERCLEGGGTTIVGPPPTVLLSSKYDRLKEAYHRKCRECEACLEKLSLMEAKCIDLFAFSKRSQEATRRALSKAVDDANASRAKLAVAE